MIQAVSDRKNVAICIVREGSSIPGSIDDSADLILVTIFYLCSAANLIGKRKHSTGTI
jgi:hypothetical protein